MVRKRARILSPGATIGMLGGGQLGRMFALVARQFGYSVQVFGDLPDSPCGQISDRVWNNPFTDETALNEFARSVDVVTYEFENIPVSTVSYLTERVEVRPGVELLRAAQHRLLEKNGLRAIGIPTADFLRISSVQELREGIRQLGGSGILKTVTMGYDGKGQAKLNQSSDVDAVWTKFNVKEAILEQEIHFDCEISVVGSRFPDGTIHCFQPSLNHHENHILDVSVTPAPVISTNVVLEAKQITSAILEHFDVIGVLCVEFFLSRDGSLLVNEIAPRPHNSGHLTIDACGSSQFEQQLRAVCGLPSGDVTQHRPAAMINLLGDHLQVVDSDCWKRVFGLKDVHVHMYGKSEARIGRKMGHMTAIADTDQTAEALARHARAILMKTV
ncbi:MAG: 5-(carboxyamino)imidazole ribonucleotide synthase [Planctomyces sp.]|nr:5-(carboxyamino)imidazole ribonucleotide synthase [Planctomyces sp.]